MLLYNNNYYYIKYVIYIKIVLFLKLIEEKGSVLNYLSSCFVLVFLKHVSFKRRQKKGFGVIQ